MSTFMRADSLLCCQFHQSAVHLPTGVGPGGLGHAILRPSNPCVAGAPPARSSRRAGAVPGKASWAIGEDGTVHCDTLKALRRCRAARQAAPRTELNGKSSKDLLSGEYPIFVPSKQRAPSVNAAISPIVAQVPTVLRTHSDGPWETPRAGPQTANDPWSPPWHAPCFCDRTAAGLVMMSGSSLVLQGGS